MRVEPAWLDDDDAEAIRRDYPANLVAVAYATAMLRSAIEATAAAGQASQTYEPFDRLDDALEDLEIELVELDMADADEQYDDDDDWEETPGLLPRGVKRAWRELVCTLEDEIGSLSDDLAAWLDPASDGESDAAIAAAERFSATAVAALNLLQGAEFPPGGLHPRPVPLDERVEPVSKYPALRGMLHGAALRWAQVEHLDPNRRCAAVTIALAALVDPKRLHAERDDPGPGKRTAILRAEYRGLGVTMDEDCTGTADATWFRLMVRSTTNSTSGGPEQALENLAVSYGDHVRNLEVLAWLRQQLPRAVDDAARAGVLALAWTRLQRQEVVERIRTGGNGDGYAGHFIGGAHGVLLRVEGQHLRLVAYPGADLDDVPLPDPAKPDGVADAG